MSQTTTPAATPPAEINPTHIESAWKWAKWAMQGIANDTMVVGADWNAIKNSDAWKTIIPLAENFAKSELSARGIPVTPATDLAEAIGQGLDFLAALHPKIQT